jgi:hypothetical protein
MKRSGRALAVWVGIRVLLIAAALEILYLAAGNIALWAGLPSKLVASSKDLKLTYRSGWTFWPGRVHVRDLTLRAKDHNVEFEVAVETATVSIALSDLFVKRFHATSLETTGTVWKMRHHVKSVTDKGLRLAAYPSIEGFPDPPLFPPVTSPPLTDENYNLWEIELENVDFISVPRAGSRSVPRSSNYAAGASPSAKKPSPSARRAPSIVSRDTRTSRGWRVSR